MKNTIKFLGAMRSIAIISMVLIIGFSFAACSDGGGGGGGGSGGGGGGGGGGKGSGYLTINGMPSGSSLSYSAYVFLSTKSIPNSSAAVSLDYLASGINGDKVFSLYVKNDSAKWTGSGSFQVVLVKGFTDHEYWKATVNFTNGSATVDYSVFTALD
jgi:hypothetical protein